MKDNLPVVLNVYKIAENSILDRMGVNLYHTAIEFDNREYSFGFIDKKEVSGVYDIIPMSYDEGSFVESINLGVVNRRKFFVKLEELKKIYMGSSYSLLTKNCNHFTNDFVKLLFDKEIPDQYAIFLKFGEFLRNIF
jgi:hypothetical protein